MSKAKSAIANRKLWIPTALAAIIYIAVLLLYVVQAGSAAQAKQKSWFQMLSRAAELKAEKPDALSQGGWQSAVAAQPYSQALVNAAIVNQYLRDDDKDRLEQNMAVVAMLGWRSTPALQNLISLAIEKPDVEAIADIGDALLRREKLVDEATTLMNLIELMPQSRKGVVRKLAARPAWRTPYLANVGTLKGIEQIDARAALTAELMAQGDELSRQELAPLLATMVTMGRTRSAYSLWRTFDGRKASLINDPDFTYAAKDTNPYFAMPFEWQARADNGFWLDMIREEGDAKFRINWDGRFAPEMLKQQTIIEPGSYAVEIEGENLDSPTAENLRFSLDCPTDAAVFSRFLERQPTRLKLALGTPLACANPLFVVSGQPSASAVSKPAVGLSSDTAVILSRITVTPSMAAGS